MEVHGGAPCGGQIAGIQWALSTTNVAENDTWLYVVIIRFSRDDAGSAPSTPSGRPTKWRLQQRSGFPYRLASGQAAGAASVQRSVVVVVASFPSSQYVFQPLSLCPRVCGSPFVCRKCPL